MRLGISIPSTDIGGDPVVQKDFAQAAEAMGYSHLAAYDHVVGVDPATRPDWKGPYTSSACFHDPFSLFGFVAAHTTNIELTTHVLILAQRQTALVARQAASIDVLSGGRLRLGVGIGWNPVEYKTLGENFSNRGVRSLEQIEVLQALWSKPHVRFEGKWHDLPDVGLNPMPVQRPIPIWLGGHHDNVLQRIATNGDGWIILSHKPDGDGADAMDRLRAMVRSAGRPDNAVGIDAWVSMGGTSPDDWRSEIEGWKKLGATHVTLNTAFERQHHRRIEATTMEGHLKAIENYMSTLADLCA